MATNKKRNTGKKPTAPKKVTKMIDLTQDKTAVMAKNYEKGVRKALARYLRDSNIPVLVELSKDSDILSRYFLNQQFYQNMLGNNIVQLNNAVKSALVDNLLDDVMTAMLNKNVAYPGVWPKGAVYATVATKVNIRRPSDNPKAGWYLTVSSPATLTDITTEEMQKLPAVECMAFADYNPNRLFQFCMEAIRQAIGMIMDQIQYNIPSACMHTATESLSDRYAREFGTILNENMKKLEWREHEHKGTLNELFTEVVSLIENPLIGHMSALMNLSGLSTYAVTKAYQHSNAKVYYSLDDDDQNDTTVYNLNDVIGNVNIKYLLVTKDIDNPMQIAFTANAAELLHVADVMNGEVPMKQSISHVGGELVRFFNHMVRYAMNIHISYPNEAITTAGQTPADGEETAPADPVTPEEYEGQ